MDTFIDNVLINLNSNNAIQNNGSFLSDVTFKFLGLLNDNPDILETKIQIINAQIPYSFYNINVYNNILNFSINGSPIVNTMTLTRGNYNSNTLITELQNQFISLGVLDITIIISSITGCLKFTKASGSISLLSSGSTIFKVLGLDNLTNYNSIGGIINCPFPLNLLGTLKLRIASDELQINSIDSSVGGSFNVLATLPIEAPNFGIILYDNLSNIQSLLDNKTLNSFDIKILDDDNNLVNLNNIGWSCTISLNILKKRNINTESKSFQNIITPLFNLSNKDESKKDSSDLTTEPIYPEQNQNNINELNPIFDETDDLDVLLYNNKGKIN